MSSPTTTLPNQDACTPKPTPEVIQKWVQDRYGKHAHSHGLNITTTSIEDQNSGTQGEGGNVCCGGGQNTQRACVGSDSNQAEDLPSSSSYVEKLDYFRKVSLAFGYKDEDLGLAEGENMGLGCGNPVATAHLAEGETVVDLGCGGGMDCFLASKKVGPTGKVIGVDMTPEMIELAKRNAVKRNVTNVEFYLGNITQLPIPDGSVDCIISNCVLNLVPGPMKAQVFRECARVLRPKKGRIALSDILARKDEMPDEIRNDAESYVGCVGGAITPVEYEALMREPGLRDVVIIRSNVDLNIYRQSESQDDTCCSSKGSNTQRDTLPAQGGLGTAKALEYDINEWVASHQIYALGKDA